jgi:phosphonate degradation associated HDIG domain protein
VVPEIDVVVQSDVTRSTGLSWERDGVAVLRAALDEALVADLVRWVGEHEADASGEAALALHHHESTDRGVALARSERFADTHEGLGAFVRGAAADIVSSVEGEPVLLFKEKVNHKRPGGAGFAPHQDARAYRFADYHVSLMVPLDRATPESGCLWFAPNPGRDLLAEDGRGRLDDSVAESLDWRPVEVEPGDVVVFDSLAPHHSGTNTSESPRRAMYLTYNRTADGDLRDRYYSDKEAEFAAADGTFGGERARISISDDFLGRPADAPTAPEADSGAGRALAELYGTPLAAALYDESVTELEHGLQAAALAEAAGAPPHLVAAALLHDIGHLLAGDLQPIDEDLAGDAHHEAVGARYLRRWFGREVTDPIAMHVAAKRYLCAVDPDYLGGLSPSSVRSLAVQGGPMSPEEAASFAQRPHHEEAVALRRWDDLAKVPGARTADFAHYVGTLDDLGEGRTPA